ncbi:MAG: hypothetical protein Q9166_005295 [cf. Caloplaca sp. 2 TL-2023]
MSSIFHDCEPKMLEFIMYAHCFHSLPADELACVFSTNAMGRKVCDAGKLKNALETTAAAVELDILGIDRAEFRFYYYKWASEFADGTLEFSRENDWLKKMFINDGEQTKRFIDRIVTTIHKAFTSCSRDSAASDIMFPPLTIPEGYNQTARIELLGSLMHL